jgi:hypothetical protein
MAAVAALDMEPNECLMSLVDGDPHCGY